MLTFYHLALPSAPFYFETRSHYLLPRQDSDCQSSASASASEVAKSAGMYFQSLLFLPLDQTRIFLCLSCDLINILYYFIILIRKIPVLVCIQSLLNACMNNVPMDTN